MGSSWRARCKQCEHTFDVNVGGGFTFHLLHCTGCGKEKTISFDELGEIHQRYLKGLPGPYSVATAEHDAAIQASFTGRPLSERAYERQVRGVAGTCPCGGSFTQRAKPRCPECRSARLAESGENLVLYD